MCKGWMQAIDEALVSSWVGVASEDDTYKEAKQKLHQLICQEIAIATDPRVNGGYELVKTMDFEEGVEINWNEIPDKYKYATADEDGIWWVFPVEPKTDKGGYWDKNSKPSPMIKFTQPPNIAADGVYQRQ